LFVKKLSDYFHVVLFTSLEPVFLRKIIHSIGEADKIMQIVYFGQSPEVLVGYPFNLKTDNILQIGDLTEFDWQLKTESELQSEEWLTPNATRKLVNCTREYFANFANNPSVRDLWTKLVSSKSTPFEVL